MVAAVRDAEGLGHGHAAWVADRGERHEVDAVRKLVAKNGRDLKREARLADPRGPEQGNQRHIVALEERAHRGDFSCAADERRAGLGKGTGAVGGPRSRHGKSRRVGQMRRLPDIVVI